MNDTKSELRSIMKDMRKALGQVQRDRISQHMVEALAGCTSLRSAQCIGLYWPIGTEFDLLKLTDRLVRPESDTPRLPVFAFPVTLQDNLMEFVVLPHVLCAKEKASLLPSCITKPALPQTELPEGLRHVSPADIDVVLIPGLAFDGKGRRLGYGGGYYDRYLARPDIRARKIGVGLIQDELDVPGLDHDIRMDAVVGWSVGANKICVLEELGKLE